MGKTISEINEEFKGADFKDWYVENIGYEIDEESNDSLTQTVCKYIRTSFKECSLSDEDAEIILKSKS